MSRQPINLRVLNHSEGDQHIDIAWNCNNAYAAQGFTIEWSTDGTNFTEIDRVGVNTTSYSDTNIQRGTYYYRVRSFNALGTSRPSNVDSVVIGNPHFPATIDHSTDFASHGDLTANGTGRFSPNAVAVGTFVGANDIGNTARAGGASFDPASGTYTLQASGADIFGSTDAFHYIYQPLNGDGEIIARITSIDPSRSVSDFVKAGVMIRETVSAESREVFMLDTRDHSFRFQRRFDPGGSTDRGPLGTEKEHDMLAVRTILHPTDFSGRSRYAFGLACALARDYGARLIVLHVADMPTVAYGGAAQPGGPARGSPGTTRPAPGAARQRPSGASPGVRRCRRRGLAGGSGS